MMHLIEDTINLANLHGIEVIMKDDACVDYEGTLVNGYFDCDKKKLLVATRKPLEDWITIFAHEASHMDQWIENSPFWTNCKVGEVDYLNCLFEWLDGKDFDLNLVDDFIRVSRDLELDCEKRTIEKLTKHGFSINIKEYVQKANSYVLFYNVLKHTRKWYAEGKAPYLIESVWRNMPDSFDVDHSKLSDEMLKLYLDNCFT